MASDEVAEMVRVDVIRSFEVNQRPGNWALYSRPEGLEPQQVAEEFGRLGHWNEATAQFLSTWARAGALRFLNDEGLRYFLPAFCVADLEGQLGDGDVDLVLCLTAYFSLKNRHSAVNPLRFGARTWSDAGRHCFSTLTTDQAKAIVAYLRWKRARVDEDAASEIDEALDYYWEHRTTPDT